MEFFPFYGKYVLRVNDLNKKLDGIIHGLDQNCPLFDLSYLEEISY